MGVKQVMDIMECSCGGNSVESLYCAAEANITLYVNELELK